MMTIAAKDSLEILRILYQNLQDRKYWFIWSETDKWCKPDQFTFLDIGELVAWEDRNEKSYPMPVVMLLHTVHRWLMFNDYYPRKIVIDPGYLYYLYLKDP